MQTEKNVNTAFYCMAVDSSIQWDSFFASGIDNVSLPFHMIENLNLNFRQTANSKDG